MKLFLFSISFLMFSNVSFAQNRQSTDTISKELETVVILSSPYEAKGNANKLFGNGLDLITFFRLWF